MISSECLNVLGTVHLTSKIIFNLFFMMSGTVELTQKETTGTMKQKGEPRKRPTHIHRIMIHDQEGTVGKQVKETPFNNDARRVSSPYGE